MSQADIGLVGLAVMGENFILNMESKGFTVACYNRTVEKVDRFMEGRAKGKNIIGCRSIEEFVGALKRPRKCMLLVKAGGAVDAFIDQILPHLEDGDIIYVPPTVLAAAAMKIEEFIRPIARAFSGYYLMSTPGATPAGAGVGAMGY